MEWFNYFRIDKDGSMSVDWKEWRNYFQLYPRGDLEAMVQYWRQSLVSLGPIHPFAAYLIKIKIKKNYYSST